MSTRRTLFTVIALGSVAAVAVALYLFQPWRLFTTVTVDEAPIVAVDGAPPPVIAEGASSPMSAAPPVPRSSSARQRARSCCGSST